MTNLLCHNKLTAGLPTSMDDSLSLAFNSSYRRFSNASITSMKTDSSTVSPVAPSTPTDSFGSYHANGKQHPGSHSFLQDGPGIISSGGAYSYLADLGQSPWQFPTGDHVRAGGHDGSHDLHGQESFCEMGGENSFQFSSFLTDIEPELEFSRHLDSTNQHFVTSGLGALSSTWSTMSSGDRSTVSPSETFHVPEIASASVDGFDQVSWGFPNDTVCHMPPPLSSLQCYTPPASPSRLNLRQRAVRGTQIDLSPLRRRVRSGSVQKSPVEHASPTSIRRPCNEIIYIKAADGSTKPAVDADGNPKICTKSFLRAEHLTRHKRTDGHSRMESKTFCPVSRCKKSKEANSAFGGSRRDNLVDHFKKTHCQESDHNGRNRRITRKEAEGYGIFWLQVWDAAQPDQKLKELSRIWKPHGGPDQDPHQVIEFFVANDIRLTAAQLHRRLNHPALEDRISRLLPSMGEPRVTKAGKCKSRAKRAARAR